jgi:16S rRNA (adenine(1408)-N(1))-methyltransferase
MEILRGKHASILDTAALAALLAGYDTVHVDIGTGDGRFVQHVARALPRTLAIGIDACRENLRDASRKAPANALFVIASAQALPGELDGQAAHVSINFPWGSLLDSLLDGDAALYGGLRRVMRPGAALDVRLNSSALGEAGWALEAGAARIREALAAHDFALRRPEAMDARELKSYPTTWAKRLAFGRDPRAVWLRSAP